ncbi:MAG: SpoIIE family protein phosphatase [Armatimonadetes bacterium]|nr:SpoIIE family protein phosphatase [Armatimonadota bacterium]
MALTQRFNQHEPEETETAPVIEVLDPVYPASTPATRASSGVGAKALPDRDSVLEWLQWLSSTLSSSPDLIDLLSSVAPLLGRLFNAETITLHTSTGSRLCYTAPPLTREAPVARGGTPSLASRAAATEGVSTGIPSAAFASSIFLQLEDPLPGRIEIRRAAPPFTEEEVRFAHNVEVCLNQLLRQANPAESEAKGEPASDSSTPSTPPTEEGGSLRRTLQQLGTALQAGAELEETLQAVADLAMQIVHAESAVIRLRDPEGNLAVRATSGGKEIELLRQITFAPDEGVIGQVASERRPQIVNEFDPAQHPFTETVIQAGIHNFLCVPILSESRQAALGTLTLHNKQDRQPFSEEDQATLSAFAAHAAVAVEKALLREEQQLAAREAAILHEVTSAMATLNLSSVLSVAVEKVAEVSGVERCCLFLYDPETGLLRGAHDGGDIAWCALDYPRARVPLPPADPLYRRLNEGVPVDLPDPNATSPSQAKLLDLLPGSFHVLIPLLNHQQLVGVMALTPPPDAPPLSIRQCRILVSVGRQIASAIENARLFEEADHRVRELSALQRISQALSSSLQMKEMLETVLVEVMTALDGTSGSIMLFSPARNTLRIEACCGLPVKYARRVVKLGDGVSGWVALHRESLRMENLAGDPRFRLLVPRPEITSAMVVPLLVKQKLLGVLCVNTSSDERRYSEQDLNLMRTMAASIAVAIENARLYDEERNIAQIARATLLPSLPLVISGLDIGEKHQPAREVGGDYYSVFEMPGGRVGILVSDVSGKSVHAAMHAAMGKHFIRALAHRCTDPAEVLRCTNELIARETPPEIFISIFFGMLDVPTGRLVYSNAGHVPPLVVKRDHTLEELSPTGMLLGLWDDSTYESRETVLEVGEALLCYTDGVTEARRERALFGDDRLRSALAKHAHEPSQKIVDAIYRRTLAFSGKKIDDDLALLAIKRV